MTRHIFIGGLIVEICTFSAQPTTIESFKSCYWQEDGESGYEEHYWGKPLIIWQESLKKDSKTQLTSGFCAGAMPAGRIPKEDYIILKEKLLSQIEAALKTAPLDCILLHMHGAMAAENEDDCEGDIVSAIRELVGAECFIGAVFDPHTNLSTKMSENFNAMVWLKEYPHTDIEEASKQLLSIAQRTLNRETNPATAISDTHCINLFPTKLGANSPIQKIVAKMRELEKAKDIEGVFLVHGFPWSDNADNSAKVVVISNNNLEKATNIATALSKTISKIKTDALPLFYTLDEALSYTQEHKIKSESKLAADKYPVTFADFADNVGGGAMGDSTFILKELLKSNLKFALATIWDVEAVNTIFDHPTNSIVTLEIGGKFQPFSGKPISIEAKIKAKSSDLSVNFAGSIMRYGRAIILDISGSLIIINDIRTQAYSTACFTNILPDIDLKKFDILVAKSMIHFRDSFKKISGDDILTVTTPGALTIDFASLPYTKVPESNWRVSLPFKKHKEKPSEVSAACAALEKLK